MDTFLSTVFWGCIIFAVLLYGCSVRAFYVICQDKRDLFGSYDTAIFGSLFWPLVMVTWVCTRIMDKHIGRGRDF